jgi:putative transport protein
METIANTLRGNPELALFLSLAIGYTIGNLRVGSFEPGAVLGTLFAALLVGQFVIDIPDAMKSAFFLMFMFGIGFRTGPEFFHSLRSSAFVQLGLILVFALTALIVTWSAARALHFDRGTTAGLLAGAQTNSTALGSATSAAARLNIDASARTRVASEVAQAYALTYVLGVLLSVWFVPNVGPRLMGVNLRDSCRKYERQSESGTHADSMNSAFRALTVRAYRLPATLVGKSVREVETQWESGQRVIIPRIRRGDSVIEATATTQFRAGDVIAAAGRSSALVADANPLKEEVNDPALVDMPFVPADLVLTNSSLGGQSLSSIAEHLGARGIFLTDLHRGGRDMPFLQSTVIERGDVLSVTGNRSEIDRIAAEVGYAVYPSASTDIRLVAASIFLGAAVGLPALVIGGVRLGLSVPGGVLLAGLTLGYLRSIKPKFGGIPNPSAILLESLGLAGFIGCVGLQSAPGIITQIRHLGGPLLLAATLVTLLPPIVTILVGYYVAHMPPGVLLGLCAGSGTSAPTLAALQKAADSKVPTLGYGLACATGNVLIALLATLLLTMGN